MRDILARRGRPAEKVKTIGELNKLKENALSH
jgi:hypothetical protein